MTSVLLVDTIKNSLDSADTVSFTGGIIAPGSVIQHKVHNSTTSTTATGVTAYTDLGGASFSFTPKQSGSKLMITMINHIYIENAGTGWGAATARLVVDGNAQSEKGDGGNNNSYGVGIRDTDGSGSSTTRIMGYDVQEHEYTTTGTSVITIKAQHRVTDDANQIQYNKYGRGSITVLEVAQ